MAEKINIVCWKWKPVADAPNTKKKQRYTADHVNALYLMLKKHVTLPFQLICVTDDPEGLHSAIKVHPLWSQYRYLGGCFTRLVCFKKDFTDFGERFISIDLDCIITSNIDELLQREEDCTIWSPTKGDYSRRTVDYCGSFWQLKAGACSEVYDSFNPALLMVNHKGVYAGGTDQKHISNNLSAATYSKVDGLYNFIPDIVMPGKTELSENCRIVFFNGPYSPDDPAIAEVFPWVAENYPLAGQGEAHFKYEKLLNKRNAITLDRARKSESVSNVDISYIVYWWGGWPNGSEKLGPIYIKRLIAGLFTHTPDNIKKRVILFTDNVRAVKRYKFAGPVDVRALQVPSDLKWNLKKMFMFSDEANIQSPAICFDLDCVITGPLTPLVRQVQGLTKPVLLATCRGAYRKGRMGGSVVGFKPTLKLRQLLWDSVCNRREEIERATKGSERIFYQQTLKKRQVAFWDDTLPNKVCSYKVDCAEGLPKGTSIVRFHGVPRPHEVQDKWMQDHWGKECK